MIMYISIVNRVQVEITWEEVWTGCDHPPFQGGPGASDGRLGHVGFVPEDDAAEEMGAEPTLTCDALLGERLRVRSGSVGFSLGTMESLGQNMPAELLFLPPSCAGDPCPGSSVIRTHSHDLASLPMQLTMPALPGGTKEQDTEEPKASAAPRGSGSHFQCDVSALGGRCCRPRFPPGTQWGPGALQEPAQGHQWQLSLAPGPERIKLGRQKRKGGWPKGKKRKPPKDLSVPRAPTTGYVIFLNEQRSQLRAKYPDLPFTEITKILAAQWAQLSQERKQRYIYEADEDKQRYIRELQAYQSSEAYRAFLRRRAAHRALCGPGAPGGELGREDLDFSAIDGTEDGDLHCRTCHQCFSSRHNKREHLLGRQHLHNLTGEFKKDSAEYLRHLEPPEEEEGRNLHKPESEEEAEGPSVIELGALAPGESFASLDLCFWQEFIWKLLKMKEFELGELRSTLERAQVEQEALQRQLAEFQGGASQQQRLEVELASLRTCGLVLEKELENLNMLLLLSCFGLQMADTDVGPAFLAGAHLVTLSQSLRPPFTELLCTTLDTGGSSGQATNLTRRTSSKP
ncbi:High mobility group protein 20A [Heterocephalus glaber]|uniref:High mobility group protein 20A n=1 Tax=Heterocephalus glaber TaxID=10181 RepID=G5B320_HETGA|nr:High mobility group protein 20A [Heterocephalus glaber]